MFEAPVLIDSPQLAESFDPQRCNFPTPLGDVGLRIGVKRRAKRGEYLHRFGAQFHALYFVRSGSYKTLLLAEDGREQVTGFYLAGDVLGLDAISAERYASDAIALEDSEILEVPFTELEALSRRDPALQTRLYRMLSGEIQRDHSLMLLLGSMRAEERLAAFLLTLSRRYAERGYSATRFVLRMTREEIGSYLGLKLETVSRLFSRLQEQGMLRVNHREVEIRNFAALRAVIGRSQSD